jgi:outer membrane protein TolC
MGAGSNAPDKAASSLPAAPAPAVTPELTTSQRDYSKAYASFVGNPLKMYSPTAIDKASFANSVRLSNLVKDGKIYLSLSDAIALAIENNYDIAIARYDLDIAETDILRTRTGSAPLGAPSGLVTGTLGGSSSILSTGGGPGGTTVGAGGAGSGVSGLTLTTAGAGPAPAQLDPSVTGAIQFDRDKQPTVNFFQNGTSSTNTYNFTYAQGFVTGANLQFTFNNTYATSSNAIQTFSPELVSNYKAMVTQHLLAGAGIWVNKRFMYQALNDRRITDASFRQQMLYTVDQVESIYWGLVQAYEDVQAKERALEQSTQLLQDNQKQLQIGSMAPLDVVNAQSTVATDKQSLISSQNTLNYQQQIIKQAIARNLNDATLSAAPVIPTDRVSLEAIPEESEPVEALVQEAFQRRPELEEAALTVKNDEITLKGARNALLPTLDVYGYWQGQGISGRENPNLNCSFFGGTCPVIPPTGYGTALNNSWNNSAPDRGMGFNLTIPIRNRYAQSVQERSLMEYRQAELRQEQLYTQIRMQVVNAMYALTNDRAAVQSAQAARDYDQQSLEAEVKKLRLGASTTANVLQQQRSLAGAEANLISAHASYAKDRAGLYQILASTLQHYGINLEDAAKGVVSTQPTVPGVQPAPPAPAVPTNPPASYLQPPQKPEPAVSEQDVARLSQMVKQDLEQSSAAASLKQPEAAPVKVNAPAASVEKQTAPVPIESVDVGTVTIERPGVQPALTAIKSASATVARVSAKPMVTRARTASRHTVSSRARHRTAATHARRVPSSAHRTVASNSAAPTVQQ